MLLPAAAEAGPILVMERLAFGVTVVDCTVPLFAAFGSVAPEAGTLPVSESGPAPGGPGRARGGVRGRKNFADPPLPIEPLVQVMLVAEPLQPAGSAPNVPAPLMANVVEDALASGPALVMVAV